MTDDATEHLRGALSALRAKDPEAALRALLEAWRVAREPRLADLVDRVTPEVNALRPAVAGKSVKARTEAVLALAKKKNPLDLGRLLAVPLPGKWQDALPVVEALVAFPADPRLATALAKLVADAPYDTWTSHRLYEPVATRLASLADARVLPVLEGQRAKVRSTYWRQGTGPAVERAVEKLRARAPAPLSEPATQALAELEAFFSGEVRAEAAKARGEAEFVADILRSPDDLALRQVFADFLTERGDPRGEHVALGLARREERADDKMRRREAALAKKHGAAWAGALDPLFSKDGRVFDCGFLAEGTLELVPQRTYQALDALPAAMRGPELTTVRTLTFGGREVGSVERMREILALPALAGLRVMRGLGAEALVALAEGPPRPALEELDARGGDEPAAQALLAEGRVLPGLRRLNLEASPELDWLFSSPAARRLEQFTLRNYTYPIGAVLGCAERHGLGLRELAFAERFGMARPEWRFVLRRGPDGRFSDLEGRSEGASRVPSSYDLEKALANVPEGSLRRFTVPPHESCPYDEDDIGRVEEALARFPGAGIQVPWRRVQREEPAGEPLSLTLQGTGLGVGAHLERLLALVEAAPVSLGLDAYAVDQGAHQPLRGSPAEAVRASFAKKRPWRVSLYREAARSTAELVLHKSGDSLGVTSAWRSEPGFLDAYVAWVRDLVDSGEVSGGSAGYALPCRALSHLHVLGFVHVLGPKLLPLLPPVALAKLDGRPALPCVRVVTGRRAALLVVGDTPEPPGAEQVVALEAALAEVLDDAYPSARGYRLSTVARELTGDCLRAHGFAEQPASPADASLGQRTWRCDAPSGPRRVRFELNHPVDDETTFFIWLEEERALPDAPALKRRSLANDGERDRFAAADAAQVRASFGRFVAAFERETMAWFEEAAPRAKKRR